MPKRVLPGTFAEINYYSYGRTDGRTDVRQHHSEITHQREKRFAQLFCFYEHTLYWNTDAAGSANAEVRLRLDRVIGSDWMVLC